MIDLHELSSDDEMIQSPIPARNTLSSSNISVSSNQCASAVIRYNPSNIKTFLKQQPDKYVLVENLKVNHAKPSPCWNRFALPAVKDENDRDMIIKNFATCRVCLTTYTYTYGSTKSLNGHKCPKESSSSSLCSSPSYSIKSSLISRNNRFLVEKKKKLTSTITKWICESMRPISIVEDEGLLNIIQQFLNWNDGPLPTIDVKDIVPSRYTIAREISRQAEDIRECLGVVLRNAAKQGCLAISPDMWKDKFKQNSYLGLTAHYVDDHHCLHSIDLCCEPYNEINQRAENIRKVITCILSRFDLDDIMNKITFVCDRGTNLVKALEDYQMVNCFPHRLNNVIKRTFYSAGTQEKVEKKRKRKVIGKDQIDDQFTRNISISNDDDPLMDYDDRDSSESEADDDVSLDPKAVELALRSLSSSPERDHVNVLEQDLPLYASQVLSTIVRCKQLCAYVKRVNWNPLLQELKKPTIKQEIIVRWLTMSHLLESILSSYSTLTNIASEKGTLHTLPSIDVSAIAGIVGVFTPWKHVIERVQATKTPSLHLVVTSYWYLLESLIVTKDEAADKTTKGIVFFKRRARQLLKAMFTIHDLHWMAAVLNPRTRMLKLATDLERNHAHGLIRSELAKMIEFDRIDDNPLNGCAASSNNSPSSGKRFKSYTAQFEDDTNHGELRKNIASSMCARRELETYLQLDLTKCQYSEDENDDPLSFWKENMHVLPNLSKLAKKVLCIPASSAAVERTFSSAGVIISQRRCNISPSTVNDIILIRSNAIQSQNLV